MIYTITLNPALDYTAVLPELSPGRVNRLGPEQITPGGKGLNVSMMLRRLGTNSVALGFAAGFTGRELERLLQESGCRTELIFLPEGCTRINLKLQPSGTELNGQGPSIPREAAEQLLSRLDRLSTSDYLVLAGNVPPSLPPDSFRRILERGGASRLLVDCTGEQLRQALSFRPFLVKPNHHELGDLFGEVLSTPDEILSRARSLQELGARNVLVSMGGDGALLLDEAGGLHSARPPQGQVINPVGAGDSMVAGFLAGWLEREDYAHAFRMGLCAGSATAFSPWLGGRSQVDSLLAQLS
ncbi:MAG: 1-phosphofructokinase family hexose kinase [Oscillospiraceae bacterium]|jgi:1-phosphofructokinase|nr:1-phosphofructokinase family hexose kinase [Oscillospiraceae bacterium]